MKALFILGPTAVGKTALAFYLAQKIPASLISADSIQVYRGLDIISGKDQGVSTALLNIVDPSEEFHVRNFVDSARIVVKNVLEQNRVPIIVGGTGFYAESLLNDVDTINILPDFKLREQLHGVTIEHLQKRLKKDNPERFEKLNSSDLKNRRRLIRAIEIASNKTEFLKNVKPVFEKNEVLLIGLETSRENLRARIAARVDKRLEDGAIAEAEKLFKNYDKLVPQVKDAGGYKELFEYLLGKTDLEEAKERWIFHELRLAKKQMTYLRRIGDVNWFDIEKNGFERSILELISLSLRTNDRG